MKLSPYLLQAISLGIAVTTLASSCHPNEVTSGTAKQEKSKKGKTDQPVKNSCPACGMG